MSQADQSYGGGHDKETAHGRPYLMFWINMILGLAVMYAVMFTMIDGWHDFRNNLNMLYMAVTMWAPMGIFMLATMPGMFPDRKMNIALYVLFAVLTAGSFWATRAQAAIDDRQFIASMIQRSRTDQSVQRDPQGAARRNPADAEHRGSVALTACQWEQAFPDAP